ncbi:unnamed protein product [Mesocestoides corti]|uniref:POU domain protein n=2 Tax=Mesocestoides corti TaxID=53468 RepID=A0A0R3UHS2_MESCO|nr:unnamed protein product [Mesocestoides corti]
MTTERPLQVATTSGKFPKDHIPSLQHSMYPSQREHVSDQTSSDQLQQTGSLMRGYSFLADHIYRSVSNPLYKLVRTVEDTVGAESASKHPDEGFQSSYQSYQATVNLKFESNGGLSSEGAGKTTVQPVHRQQGFNVWDASAASSVQQWYPRAADEVLQPTTEAFNNWPPAHSAQGETQKPATPPQSASPSKAAAIFHQHHQQQNRYQQQYFQEWADANHSATSAVATATAYYPQFDETAGIGGGTPTSPRVNDEASFPQTTSNGGDAPACPGCCIPPSAPSAYPETGGELQSGLCLVDPMRALPRYLTTGLWPPVIGPAKLEWSGSSGVSDDDARLLDMNRFYGDGSYRMPGAAAAAVYPGYGGGMQDTKDFFFTSSRYTTVQDATFRHKVEAHRLSVTAVDCDPQELEAFAERFKQRRIKLGVTQADVGKALGRLNLAGVGSFSQSTICRFESLTLSHNNMLALKPILQAWLDEAEQEAAARQKNPNAYDPDEDDKKRKRTSITDPEKRSLEAFFGIQPRPSSEKIAQIAEKLNLKKNVVRVWFCNQRQKQKRMKFSTVGLLHQVNGM